MESMKEVYVVHVFKGELSESARKYFGSDRVVDLVLIPNKEPWERLDYGDLENVFMAHNIQSSRLSMTGYDDRAPLKDYIVDPYWFEVWSCEPVGWKKLKSLPEFTWRPGLDYPLTYQEMLKIAISKR